MLDGGAGGQSGMRWVDGWAEWGGGGRMGWWRRIRVLPSWPAPLDRIDTVHVLSLMFYHFGFGALVALSAVVLRVFGV